MFPGPWPQPQYPRLHDIGHESPLLPGYARSRRHEQRPYQLFTPPAEVAAGVDARATPSPDPVGAGPSEPRSPGRPSNRKKRDKARIQAVHQTLQFNRAELKVSVFETYAVCSALLAGFSSSVAMTPASQLATENFWIFMTISVQQALLRLCSMGAIHSMLVFIFAALYCKQALSRSDDHGVSVFEIYSGKTAKNRNYAFWSMYYSALLYVAQVVLSVLYTYRGTIATFCVVALLIMVLWVYQQTQEMVSMASFVFMTDEQAEELFGPRQFGDDVVEGDVGSNAENEDEEDMGFVDIPSRLGGLI